MKNKMLFGCLAFVAVGGVGAGLIAQGLSTDVEEVAAASSLGEHVVSVSSGYAHTLALTSRGCVYGFGYAVHGEIGDGTSQYKTVPTKLTFSGLASGETITSVKTSKSSSYALTSSHNVYSWGYNYYGQLGDGTIGTNQYSPEKISISGLDAGETIDEIGAAGNSAYALTSSGNVYSWGWNNYGQLGDGTTKDRSVPAKIAVSGLDEGEKIVTLRANDRSVFALTSSKNLYVWGANDSGQLGDGTGANQHTPEKISLSWLGEGETIESFDVGYNHSCIISSTGNFYDCGSNSMGQLGDGTTYSAYSFKKISFTGLDEGETIASASFGDLFSLALSSSGRIFAWGNNSSGQLGDGTTANKLVPTLISINQLASEETVVSITAGDAQSYGVTSNGNLFAWGYNYFGQLGNGTTTTNATTTSIASQLSPDYVFAANLFGYKTCTEYDTAFSALSSDYSALTTSQVNNLAAISYMDYPTLSQTNGSYNYAGSSKTVSTTASTKWAAIVSLHQAAQTPSAIIPTADSSSWDTLSVAMIAVMAIGTAVAYSIKRKKNIA